MLTNPEDGNVIVPANIYLSEAQYQCNEGFTAIGATVRVCEADGEWSGTAPHCEGTLCYTLEYSS